MRPLADLPPGGAHSKQVFMIMRRLTFRFAILSLSCTCSPLAFANQGGESSSEQVDRVLREMSTAVRELNYQGLFTYEVGGALDSYRIIHRVDDETEQERLLKLNGPPREIVRSGHMTDCLSRGDQLLRGLLRSTNASSELRDNYNFYLTGDERVADRMATVMHIVPKDGHRFGYSLSIDKQTGLPLKAMRVNADKRVMERIQFIELTVGEPIADAALQPSSAQSRTADHDLIECGPASDEGRPAWRTQWLPPGFVFAGQRQSANGAHMQTYTDGLATFTIFIGEPNSQPAMQGRAQLGATVAYVDQRVWQSEAHSVTVVGEIPFATAQRVVAALELQ